MEELANYEDAYKGLSDMVQVSGNDDLKQMAKELDGMMTTNSQVQEKEALRRADEPSITQDEFAGLGYTERLKLSKKHPEFYNQLVGGGQ